MHDQPRPTEEEQELTQEDRHSEEEKMRYPDPEHEDVEPQQDGD